MCFQSIFHYAVSPYLSLLLVHISLCFNPIFQSGSVSTSVQVLWVYLWSMCDANVWCVFSMHASNSCVFVCVFQAKKSYQNRCQEKDQVDTQVAQVKTGSVNAQPKDLEKLYNKQSRIRQDQERAGMRCLYIAFSVVNCGISNTFVLEIPHFTIKPVGKLADSSWPCEAFANFFFSRKCIWNCTVQKMGHFAQASMCHIYIEA